MFINSDIQLSPSFAATVSETLIRFGPPFLIIGRRTNLPMAEGEPVLYTRWAQDYFAFSKDLFPSVPAFAIGRAVYDNWCARAATLS